jgi:hypothetical protein
MSPPDRLGGVHWKGLVLSNSVPRVDLGVLGIAALLLASGLAYARGTIPGVRHVKAQDGAIRMTLPAGWVGTERAGRFIARKPSLVAAVPTTVEIARVIPAPRPRAAEAGEFLDAAEAPAPPAPDPALATETELARMEEERRRSGVGHRVLETEEKNAFGGHRSVWSHWALVRDPAGTSAGAAVLPVVVRGVDVLVPRGDRGFWRVSAEAPASADGALDPEVVRAIESVRLAR